MSYYGQRIRSESVPRGRGRFRAESRCRRTRGPGKDGRTEDNASLAADSPPVAKESDPEDKAQPDIPLELPVLPVRDIVVFNYMILPLFVGREKSVQAVDAALTVPATFSS